MIQAGRRLETLQKPLAFWSLAALAIALRLCAMAWPANYDQVSWSLVADIVLEGKNTYATTYRYNYGPAWMYILAGLKWLAGDAHFRLAVCLFLSGIDVATAVVLRKRGLYKVAVLFLFSPWTIFITGHHHMFDNAAVLIGLIAVTWVEGRPGMRDGEQRLSALSMRDTLIGAALIGCSLIMKHLLWLFPFWMAFRVRSFPRRLVWLCVPMVMFAASFVPFWREGSNGIVTHVLHYTASSNAPLFYMVAPNIVNLIFGNGPHHHLVRVLFGATLLLAGVLLRRRTLFEWYIAYLVFLVLLSSGIWNQFFVIPVIFTLLYPNVWGVLFNVLAIPYYIIEDVAFNYGETMPPAYDWIEYPVEAYGRHTFIVLLAACYLQAFWSAEIARGWKVVWSSAVGSLRGQQ